MPKVALITGITGHDGSYLAEPLLQKGHEVHGLVRRSSLTNTSRIDHMIDVPQREQKSLTLPVGDLSNSSNLTHIADQTQPAEIYNLSAQSHVAVSFDAPEYAANVDALGTLRLLEVMRLLKLDDETRFYQASTWELYGQVRETPQSETTSFCPRSSYACAKLYAYWIAMNYRESYGIYACKGILFNHKSTRRGEKLVTHEITRALATISLGLEHCLYLGNLDSTRAWGHAKDCDKMQ